MIDVAKIKEENARRQQEINKRYDPLTGEGGQGDRVCLRIEDAPYSPLYLPKEMMDQEPICQLLQQSGSFAKAYERNDLELTEEEYVQAWIDFCEIRANYDFEFFAYVYETIEDGDTHEDISFRLNRAQRDFLGILDNMRVNNIPIRSIVLKARQLGLSTLIQLYMYWIQAVHRKNWHSVICAHEMSASVTIRAMFDKVIQNMPAIFGEKFTIAPFKGSQNIKYVPERGCRITVGTAERPESVRSQNPAMAHMSEVAFYPNTEKRTTAQLIASIVGPMKRQPYTLLVYESTANGVGDYFHGEWEKSKKGESAFVPVFLPWYYKEEYSHPIEDRYYNHSGKSTMGSIEDFILSLNEYELNLFWSHPKCTLENINWYRGKNSEMSSDEIMKQEYPSDDVEAFQDSGLPAFRSYHIEALRKDCKLPVAIGTLLGDALPSSAKTDESKRKNILSNVRFIEDTESLSALSSADPKLRARKERDKLKIWKFPDKSVQMSHRYVVVFDPQKGLSEKADWGVITVLDRSMMRLKGGKPEVVAEWRGRIDKDIAVWVAAQIATYYNNALLVIESNTFENEKNKNQDDSEFIFDTIAEYYSNLYTRTPADKIVEGVPAVWGWHTNKKTKTMIINNYVVMLRERGYIERNEAAFNEARVYEQKDDGSFGAKDGHHDDILMTRMIGCHICYELPAPVVIETVRKFRNERPVNESSF